MLIFFGVCNPRGVSGLYLYGPFSFVFSSPQNNLLYHFLTVGPFGLTDWQRACFQFWRDRRLSPAHTTGFRIARLASAPGGIQYGTVRSCPGALSSYAVLCWAKTGSYVTRSRGWTLTLAPAWRWDEKVLLNDITRCPKLNFSWADMPVPI